MECNVNMLKWWVGTVQIEEMQESWRKMERGMWEKEMASDRRQKCGRCVWTNLFKEAFYTLTYLYIYLFIIYCRSTQTTQSSIAESLRIMKSTPGIVLWLIQNYRQQNVHIKSLKPLSKPIDTAQIRCKAIQSALQRHRNTLKISSWEHFKECTIKKKKAKWANK